MTDMVSSYLERVEPARREVVAATAALVRAHLPSGFVEAEAYGMPTWIVPPSVKPATYNGQPLGVVALASQKGHVALYLMGLYAVPEARAAFEAAYAKSGKRLDMGKSCLRFSRLEDVAVDVLAAGLRAVGPEALVEAHDHAHAGRKLKPVPGVGGAASAVKTAKATKTAKAAKTTKTAKVTKAAKATKATKTVKATKAAKTTKATKAAKTAKAARHA